MYLDYWKFKEKPFENTPNPKFLYNSEQHEEAFARMMYVVKEGKGAGMLTGVFGCGKTVLSRALNAELEQHAYKVALVVNPRLNDVGILKMICRRLGNDRIPEQKVDILMMIEDTFQNNLRDGRKTVIIIDEAHSITDSGVFEEIRMLLNFQDDNQFMLTLLLLGQDELKTKVEANKQLLQRIAMRFHLASLDLEGTDKYIRHRIVVAGGNVEFPPDAVQFIFEQSGGIPRRINQISDMCLFTGMSSRAEKIDTAVAREAVVSLER